MASDSIQILFGGLGQLGPGSDEDTLNVLRSLPDREFGAGHKIILDVGCGNGRQTIALARELQRPIHAIDNQQPFLVELQQRAIAANVKSLVQTHCMDMQAIGDKFPVVDLLWCEGAAYNIGFENALRTWRPLLRPNGVLVVSELCWLTEQIPDEVRGFFEAGYPGMQSKVDNQSKVEAAGYQLQSSYELPADAWTKGYYDALGPRATSLIDHEDETVREFAASTLHEIDIFSRSEGSYGYVFFIGVPCA